MTEIITFRPQRGRKLFAEVNPIITEMMAVIANLQTSGAITIHDTEMFRDSFREIIKANVKIVAEKETEYEFPEVIPMMADNGIDYED